MNVHFSSESVEWSTPDDFFKKLDQEFNFTLDPCATVQIKNVKNSLLKRRMV